MKITKIEVQKNNPERYNIFTDQTGREAFTTGVDETVLVQWDLKKGKELTEKELELLIEDDHERKAWNRALHYLSSVMRTEKEVYDHLIEKEFTEASASKAVEKAKDYKFLNDREFAKAFVRTKINTTDKGPKVIRMDLEKKGVAEIYVSEAMKALTDELALDRAVTAAEKKGRHKKGESGGAVKQRLLQMLLRKGYDHETASAAVKEADFAPSEEDEWNSVLVQGEKVYRKWEGRLEGRQLEQKIKEHLYRKQFPMEHIQRFLDEKREETEHGNGKKIQPDEQV